MKQVGVRRLFMPVGIAIVMLALAWWGVATASADAPTVIPYRGRLTDSGGQPVNAALPMTFALYAGPEGGTAAWVEAHAAITVTDGLFTAYLGELVPLSSAVLNDNNYLGLTVGSDSEMRPRQRWGSVPYARTLAAGAAISGNVGPLLSITNTLSAFQAGNGTALALYGSSGSGPVLSVRLNNYPGPPAAFASAIYAWRSAGIGAWPTIQATNDDAYPGLAANSSEGTALAGIAGEPVGGGSPAGGPFSPGYGTLLSTAKAGVLGYSTIGPGIFAWSTVTHSLIVSGSARITGDLVVGGDVITSADVAEHYVAVGTLEAGDVVVLDPETALGVRRADQAYDTSVAGIISTDPAIILPGAVDGVPLALVGRVPVKVDAGFGAIQVGDLLTTSPAPGHAMRCAERLQCVGAIVGKALEPLDGGSGVILALVTLQ